MPAATALGVLGIVQGRDWGWISLQVTGSLLGTVVLAALFLLRTRRVARPVIDLSLFRVRSFSVANLATLLFSIAFFAIGLRNVLFLTGVWHWSVLHAAAAILPPSPSRWSPARPGGWPTASAMPSSSRRARCCSPPASAGSPPRSAPAPPTWRSGCLG